MYGACQAENVQTNKGALHAQARIAMVNTALTAAGMWALSIPGMGLLSLFVFICSFIPIAGCFISTIPVAFVALTEYGFLKVSLGALLPGPGKTLQ
jgi:predicted PurR-regulated permease PerM